jgi:hypothetical protein
MGTEELQDHPHGDRGAAGLEEGLGSQEEDSQRDTAFTTPEAHPEVSSRFHGAVMATGNARGVPPR